MEAARTLVGVRVGRFGIAMRARAGPRWVCEFHKKCGDHLGRACVFNEALSGFPSRTECFSFFFCVVLFFFLITNNSWRGKASDLTVLEGVFSQSWRGKASDCLSWRGKGNSSDEYLRRNCG